MSYVVCKHPGVRVDIMVKRQYWADIVALIDRTGCSYWKEDHVQPVKDDPYVILRDVQAPKGNQLGDFIGLLYNFERDLENQVVADSESANTIRKFYVLIRPRKGKKEKNHAEEIREEVHAGSDSGTRGESTGDIRPGEASGDCGDSTCSDRPGTDSVLGQE